MGECGAGQVALDSSILVVTIVIPVSRKALAASSAKIGVRHPGTGSLVTRAFAGMLQEGAAAVAIDWVAVAVGLWEEPLCRVH